MTKAEHIKKLLDAGVDVALYGDTTTAVEITTAYVRLIFPDGSQLQRVWYQGTTWVVVT